MKRRRLTDAASSAYVQGGVDQVVTSSGVSAEDFVPNASARTLKQRTSRVIVAYEDSISWGYGAEIAARIADDCFAWLDAPVKRVASTDTFVGYAPRLEDAILPQVDDFKRAIGELISF